MGTQSIGTGMGNFYWLLAGALLGFGLMAVFSIGIPIFLLGMLMMLYRLRRAGGRGFGLVLVGMGAVPALYLSVRYLTGDRSSTFYSDNFWVAILVFAILAVAGAVLFLADVRRSRPQAPHEP